MMVGVAAAPSTLIVPGGGAGREGSVPGGLGSAAVVGVVLIGSVIAVWAWRRKRVGVDPRVRVFERVARRMGLNAARRADVLRLARAAKVDAPATLLLSAKAYREAERAASLIEPKPGAVRLAGTKAGGTNAAAAKAADATNAGMKRGPGPGRTRGVG
jgi:hypothetical protein